MNVPIITSIESKTVAPARFSPLLSNSKIKNYIRKNNIFCQKYNYCFDKEVQNTKHYQAKINISKNGKELQIFNKKLSTSFLG